MLAGLTLAILLVCTGDSEESTGGRPSPSATNNASLVPTTPTPVQSPSRDTSDPTPRPTAVVARTGSSTSSAPRRQSVQQIPAKSEAAEILFEFLGNGSGDSGLFTSGHHFKLILTYSGGPIRVGLVEGAGGARGIYDGPKSNGNQYATTDQKPGEYNVVVSCDGGCEWTLKVEKVDGAVIAAVASETGKTETKSDTPVPVSNNQTTSTTKVKAATRTRQKWDIFSQFDSTRIHAAPDTRVISVEYDPGSRMAIVNGGEGAVPSEATVMIGNLELGNYVLVKADGSGTFEGQIDGHPGTHILLKQDVTGEIFLIDDPSGTHGPNTLRTIFPPGVLLRIPVADSKSGLTFGSAGRLPSDEDAPWTIEGNLEQTQLQPGEDLQISGQVAIRTAAGNTPPPAELRFEAHLLVNADGRQVGGAQNFTTSLFTPTNLPIEHKDLGKASYYFGKIKLDWQFDGTFWVSDFSGSLAGNEIPEVGLYQLKDQLLGVDGLPRLSDQNILHRSFLQKAAIATYTIGSPAPMRITPTLLADELNEGSRGGGIAREDLGYFDISHRAGVRHQPVLPRLDNYGQFWTYRLDPYIPLLGVVDRSPPMAPSIQLDFSTSVLTVTVVRPGGQTDVLGPAPLARYTVKSPRTPWHRTVSEGGGNLGEIPQLQSGGDQFAYKFPVDGDYVVTLDGRVADIAGHLFAITGTYDVTIANSLDIEPSLLPGTPFDLGDALPIGLHVTPGVPAVISYKVQHSFSDGETVTREFKGEANEHGWWDGNGQFFQFQRDGEYRVDIQAEYSDPDGNLWVGRLTFGSVIAKTDAPRLLHGRRGPNGLSDIPPPWGFSEDFITTTADHIQFPYFAGDIMWGQNTGHLRNSVAVLTSIQIIDRSDPLMAQVIQRLESGGLNVSTEDLITAGQIPLGMAIKPGTVGAVDDVDFWAYVYASVQRPSVRVREHILGNDLGGTYWRFDDAYHMQSGVGPNGDLAGDFKFMYAGAVIRDPTTKQGVYAAYGSGWVMATDDDPMGARFMPPFQGSAGGPDGGPLFAVHGRDIDMFLLPLGIRSGAVMDIGDSFRMAGAIMPTLPSYVEYTVTAPDGGDRDFGGRANSIGYFYEPEDDFILDQAGLWSVHLRVVHDGMTSAGQVAQPYPDGGPLTPDGRTFRFVVKGPGTKQLSIETDLEDLSPAEWFGNVQTARFEATLPKGFAIQRSQVIVSMPGIVLVDEEIPDISGDTVAWGLDAQKLNALARNFDSEPGIADTVYVTFYVEGMLNGKVVQATGTLATHGARVPKAPTFIPTHVILPELSTFEITKTDRFLVDIDEISGGHPFKGQGTQDPDNGAHANWDNSGNRWPAGIPVTDYPAIYAVADGYVDRIDKYEPVGEDKYQYGIHYAFAQKNGRPVKFHMSLEPYLDPGDSAFYEPFIMVEVGQPVRKGDILAYMYLAPNGRSAGPHIHFSVQPDGEEQQAPAIFTEEVVQRFHANWGIFKWDLKECCAKPGDPGMPPCMGYKLAGSENPYSDSEVECLR